MIYQISPIIGYKGYFIDSRGTVWSNNKSHDLKPLRPSYTSGYAQVTLSVDTNSVYRKVHHLVLECFVSLRPNGMEGCHNNGNKHDNRLENLRWDTKSANYQDKKLHGVCNTGIRNGGCVLTEEQVIDIKKKLSIGNISQERIAKIYNVTQVMISRIKLGKAWGHIKV